MVSEVRRHPITPSIPTLVLLQSLASLHWFAWQKVVTWTPRPLDEPHRFALVIITAATLGMLLFHIVPAYAARRWAGRMPRVETVLSGVVALAYLPWVIHIGQVTYLWRGPWELLAFSTLVIGCVWRHESWRWVVPLTAAYGCSVLAYGLVQQWAGLWTQNVYQPEFSLDEGMGPLVISLVRNLAPVTAVSWHLGARQFAAATLWRTAIAGVGLPAVAAWTVVSVATQAGFNLHWRPSLPYGVEWMCGGILAFPVVVVLLTFPAALLLATVSIRLLLFPPGQSSPRSSG